MKLIFLCLLFMAAPICKMVGLIELSTLSTLSYGFVLHAIYAALPERIPGIKYKQTT